MKTKRLLKYHLGCIFFLLGIIAPLTSFSQTTHQVTVLNNKFDPATLDINVGDKVVWKNQSGYHNVNGTTATYPSNPESFGNSEGTNWEYEYVFNTPGTYDYQCDPHVGLGMTGVVNVVGLPGITVNFSGMNPHVDQDLWLSVIDPVSGEEYARVHEIIKESFSISISGLEANKSYQVDFYADFNKNGFYDKPGTDHAWRIEVENLTSDTTVNFAHNTTFTDIEWQHKLIVDFSSMTPHVGQNLWFAVIDKSTDEEILRTQTPVTAEFSLEAFGIIPEESYEIMFFADHNENGRYDAPPTDHAWMIELDDVMGDTTISFTHNTNFADIDWQHKVVIEFAGMTPHLEQDLWLTVIDSENHTYVDRVKEKVSQEFSIEVEGITPGKNYIIDFFADHNGNGYFDTPPTDHAWRIELDDAQDYNTLSFSHNTNFTDINWQHKLEVKFSGMTPHDGQDLWLSVIDKNTNLELERVYEDASSDFSSEVYGIVPGNSYWINFYADHNGNGVYNAPPTDHAWQLEVNNVEGDTTLSFSHNTSFTDIDWQHRLTVDFMDMTPHVGQFLQLLLFNVSDQQYVDTMEVENIPGAEFEIFSYSMESGKSYNIDFYADFNKNGEYDAPPTDHAWRIVLDDVVGDTTVAFMHNTEFTNILDNQSTNIGPTHGAGTGLKIYPNPASNRIYIDLNNTRANAQSELMIFDVSGKMLFRKEVSTAGVPLSLDVSFLPKGIYTIRISGELQENIMNSILIKR